MWILLGFACGSLPSLPPLPWERGAADDTEVRLTKVGDVLVSIGYCDPGDCFSIQTRVATEIDGQRVEVGMLVFADATVPLLDAGRLCALAQDVRAADRPNTWMADEKTFECGKRPGR